MPTTLIDAHTIKYSSNALPQSLILFNKTKQVGVLLFHPNASTLPPDKQAGDTIILNYHLEDFDNIRQILKKEEPVYLLYNGSDPGSENGIITGNPDDYDRIPKAIR